MVYRVFIVLLLLSTGALASANSKWLNQVESAIEGLLGEQVTTMAKKMGLDSFSHNIRISYLDPRLNLTPCEKPLTVTPPQPLKLGRNHVKVHCSSGTPWAINVPTDIALHSQVVVLNQPIGKDMTLKLEHLDYQNQNLAQLRKGYYLKKELLIGKQSKRALAGNTVLNSHLVLPALMVLKGDHVMISASRGAMSVKMPGEALSNGREGRQIRVKNTRSSRIIKAKVVAQGLVEVAF